MNKDKKILYLSSSILVAVLFAAFFFTSLESKIVTACFLLPSAIIIRLAIRKRCAYEISARSVFCFTALLGLLFTVCILASSGIFGAYKNPYFVDSKSFFDTVLPIFLLILSSEIIRATFLAQKNTLASVLSYVACVLAEVLSYSGIAGIISMNRLMDLIGLTLFPALASNIYYHYLSKHYGMASPIVFRLITTLYLYFVPTKTAMSDALLSALKVFVPILLLLLTSALYDKAKKTKVKRGHKLATVATVLVILLATSVIMLVSCQFRYGAMVIATGSMTGEINKGDVIIYERYENQPIREGQVIVFRQYNNNIIHRVVGIEMIDGKECYYTKGDANEFLDSGYRTADDIIGLTDIRIAFIGFPTLWLNDMMSATQPEI